jgi:5-methyltetrahydrofolate--homocysteine methyltransferase
MKDASQNPLVAARLMADGQRVSEELNEEYAHLREQYQQEQQTLVSLDEARKNKPDFFAE